MKFLKMLRLEMRRLFTFKNIGITLFFSFFILCMCILSFVREVGIEKNYFYNMFQTMFNGGFFFELFLIPIGYFVVSNLYIDVSEKVTYFLVSRSNLFSYVSSKFISGILYSFVMFELVFNLFVFWGMKIMPIVDFDYFSGGTDLYEDLLRRSPLAYFEMRILFVCLIMSLFVGAGMLITLLFENSYVAVLSPFLAYIIINKLELIFHIPDQVNFDAIISGFLRVRTSLGHSMGYIVLFHFSCLFLIGIVFNRLLRRKCYDE